MAYCGPKGIPLSTFLAWSEADQEMALGWQAEQDQRCKGCGTHPADWDEDQGGSRHAWFPAIRDCPGCARIASVAQDETTQHKPGRHIYLSRPY